MLNIWRFYDLWFVSYITFSKLDFLTLGGKL